MLSNIREASDEELEAKLQEKVIISIVRKEITSLTSSIAQLAKIITQLELKHGKDGLDGKDGVKGLNGKDGVNGKDGKNGLQGQKGAQGQQGEKGKDGINGLDGISVVNAEVTFDNHLVITLSNGNEIDAGEIQVQNTTQYVTQIKGESDVQYASRYDQVSDVLAYKGEAIIGALESEPLWRVQKLVFGADGDVTITWVNGNADFRYVWEDRATLTYR